ncbi:hypothetical protein GCM10009576_076840 [Streptomyces rhizosphaericus]|uniref:Uncharacterized protein n=1 Tax=Streptomyces rhizosphaericus TaxID=114699 RepID=A0ABN1SKM7_9ACTN
MGAEPPWWGAGGVPRFGEGRGGERKPAAAAPLDTTSAPPYLPRNRFRELSGYFRKAHDAHTSVKVQVKVQVKVKVHPPRVHPDSRRAAGRNGTRRLRKRRARGFG